MKRYILIILLVLPALMLLAVFDDYQPSSRARGMGNAFTGVADDINTVFYNPAGLTNVNYEINMGISNLFNQKFSEFKTIAIGAKLPSNFGTVAMGARMFDVDYEDETLMSEQVWSFAHGFNLVKDVHSTISFGYTANLYSLGFEDDDKQNAIGIDVAGLATLHGRTRFGFSVCNINNPKMGENNQNELPRKLAVGISYLPYDRVTTSIEMKKDFAEETEFMAGVEAALFDSFSIRAGVHQNPATINAGASFTTRNIVLDYSYTYHTVLDGTHYLNLGYSFEGR